MLPAERRNNKSLTTQIVDIIELSKQTSIIKKEISNHESEVRRLRGQLLDKVAETHQTVMTTAILIHGLRSNEVAGQETIFLEDDDDGRGPAQRRSISEIAASLKLLYIQDPVEPLTDEILQVVVANTQGWQDAN